MDFLDRILTDEAYRREQFPVAETGPYFGHAGGAPMCKRVQDALHGFVVEGGKGLPHGPEAVARVEETRGLAARLIGAEADEIALIGPTSLGISLVAAGIAWRPGDEVVGYLDDYPANVYPWTALTSRGVRYVSVEPEHLGAVRWEDVERVLTEKTRLVALPSCHFLTGFRLDIDGIGKRLRERGILFSVDAIQTAGACPTSVDYVDFLAADSHKWLLGTATAGIVYVRREHHDTLRPMMVGARNIESPEFVSQREAIPVAGAVRYEPGIVNFMGLHALHASLTLLLEVGIERVYARLLLLRRALLDRVEPLGYRDVLATRATREDERSGIVALTHPSVDLEVVYDRLTAEKVITSLRRDRDGATYLRFSPHFYNTEEEIARAVDLMR